MSNEEVEYDALFFKSSKELSQRKKPIFNKLKLDPVYFHDQRQGKEHVSPANWDSSLV
jgi:hypothetical protein